MRIFGATDCLYSVPRSTRASGYALGSLRSGPPILLQGADYTSTDITLPVATMSGKRFLYEFGRNIDNGRLIGVAMLGMNGASSLPRLVDAMRVSSGGGAKTLSTPVGGFRVFVNGFSMSQPDAEFNLLPFSVLFQTA